MPGISNDNGSSPQEAKFRRGLFGRRGDGLNRQQAVDTAKMYCRETRRTHYVVRIGMDEYAVWDRHELVKALAEGRCERDAIIFSIQGEADEEPA